jgi:iron complex outermembrane receptor protein
MNYQSDRTSFPDGLPAAGTVLPNPNGTLPTSRFTGEPGWSSFERDSFSAGYILDHNFSDTFSLHQTLRYTVSEYDRSQVQNRGLGPDFRTIDRRARQGTQESERINVDTRVEWKFETASIQHELLAGIDYSYAIFDTVLNQGNIAGLDLFNPQYGTPVTTPNPVFDDRTNGSQTGVYLQDQIKPWERVTLLAGLRRDRVEEKLTDHLAGDAVTEQKDDASTYRLGIVYQTPFGLAPYASYTQSFQPVSGRDAQGNLFKPEEGEQYEVGIKFQPEGHQSSLTVSAFQLTRTNALTPDPADPLNFLAQTGEIVTKGVEIEGVATLANGLSLVATYTYNDTEVTESNDIDLHKRPTTVPRYMASAWVDYAFRNQGWSGLSAGAGVRYIGDTAGDPANTFFVPEYTLVDLALRYKLGNTRFALNASNIFDKEYVSTCFSSDSCYFGARRTVTGTVTFQW